MTMAKVSDKNYVSVAEFMAMLNDLLIDGVIDDDSPMLLGMQQNHPMAFHAGLPIAVDGECWIPEQGHTDSPYSVPDEIWG